MSETKFTPGPWSLVPQGNGSQMIGRRYETDNQMSPYGLRLVCHVFARGDSLMQDEANGHLIVSAPRLYAELDILVKVLSSLENAGLLNLRGVGTLNGPRAALALARGESDHG